EGASDSGRFPTPQSGTVRPLYRPDVALLESPAAPTRRKQQRLEAPVSGRPDKQHGRNSRRIWTAEARRWPPRT
ncbi:hypothetical protein L914_20479, partial [Phytophthora nicotianae]